MLAILLAHALAALLAPMLVRVLDRNAFLVLATSVAETPDVPIPDVAQLPAS